MAWRSEVEDGTGLGGLVATRSEQREEARQAKLEKDAQRYLWLRDNLTGDNWQLVFDETGSNLLEGESLDRAVDAAIAGAPQCSAGGADGASESDSRHPANGDPTARPHCGHGIPTGWCAHCEVRRG